MRMRGPDALKGGEREGRVKRLLLSAQGHAMVEEMCTLKDGRLGWGPGAYAVPTRRLRGPQSPISYTSGASFAISKTTKTAPKGRRRCGRGKITTQYSLTALRTLHYTTLHYTPKQEEILGGHNDMPLHYARIHSFESPPRDGNTSGS